MNNENVNRGMTEEEAQELLKLAEQMVASDKKASEKKVSEKSEEPTPAASNIQDRIAKAKARQAQGKAEAETPQPKPKKAASAPSEIDEETAEMIMKAATGSINEKAAKKAEKAKELLEREENAEKIKEEKAAKRREVQLAKKKAAEEKKIKVGFLDGFSNVPVIRFFANSKSVIALILKILLLLAIPYLLLLGLGFLFEVVLQFYKANLAIFIAVVSLLLFNLFLIVLAVIRHKRIK